MGLFSTIMAKVFGHAQAQAPTPNQTAPVQAQASSTAGGVAAGAPAPAATPNVDVAAVLNDLAARNPEKLDWKRSIVDLMKLVGMESSLSERKELAAELHYTGDLSDSAAMNVWLHKQVLRKLAENGGKVPQDLLD